MGWVRILAWIPHFVYQVALAGCVCVVKRHSRFRETQVSANPNSLASGAQASAQIGKSNWVIRRATRAVGWPWGIAAGSNILRSRDKWRSQAMGPSRRA